MLKCQCREGWGWLFGVFFVVVVVFLVVCCKGFFGNAKVSFLTLCQNPSLISQFLHLPATHPGARAYLTFPSTTLSVPYLLTPILTRQSLKPFVTGLKKPSAWQYPRAHPSSLITPQSLAQTLCAWSWCNHVQPLPTVFHDRSKYTFKSSKKIALKLALFTYVNAEARDNKKRLKKKIKIISQQTC